MGKTVFQREKIRKRKTMYIYPVSVINFQAQRGSIINGITSTIAPTKSIKSNECKSVKFEISKKFAYMGIPDTMISPRHTMPDFELRLTQMSIFSSIFYHEVFHIAK